MLPPLFTGANIRHLGKRLRLRDMVESATHGNNPDGARVLGQLLAIQEIVGEPKFKWKCVLDLLDVINRQLDVQSLYVPREVLDIAAAHNGEDIGRLGCDISLGDARDDGAPCVSRPPPAPC